MQVSPAPGLPIDLQTCLLKFVPREIIHELAWFLGDYQFMLGGAYGTDGHELIFIGALIKDKHLNLLGSFLDKLECCHVQNLIRSRDPNVIEWTLTRMEKGSIPLGFLIGGNVWIPVSVPGKMPVKFMDRFQALSVIEHEQSLKVELHGGGICERYIREALEYQNLEGFKWALDHGYQVPGDWIVHHLENDVLRCLVDRKLHIEARREWITPSYVAGAVPKTYTKEQVKETVEMLHEVCNLRLLNVEGYYFCKEVQKYRTGKKVVYANGSQTQQFH